MSLLLYPACFGAEIWYRSCWLSCVYVFIGASLINGLGDAVDATAAHPVRPVAKVALTS